jgi:DNA-binding XRE family transcriptional regulator
MAKTNKRGTRPKSAIQRRITSPPEEKRLQLVHGPYQPPPVRVGQTMTCVLRGKAKVCRWSDGPIPWPIIRVGHGGRGAYAVTPELARAVRSESSAAVAHWWGAGSVTVTGWHRALGVEQFNEGTRRLWSLWKEPKLPDTCVTFSKAALRQHRLAKGMTQLQVARAVGWNSVHTYGQMESGGRWRATRETLGRLAKVFDCRAEELIVRNR